MQVYNVKVTITSTKHWDIVLPIKANSPEEALHFSRKVVTNNLVTNTPNQTTTIDQELVGEPFI